MSVEKVKNVNQTRESSQGSAPVGKLQGAALKRAEGARSSSESSQVSHSRPAQKAEGARESNHGLHAQWKGLLDGKKDADVGSIPFFAHFLEGQEKGPVAQTKRYPSDNDDSPGLKPPGSEVVTHRYPSDNDADTGIEPPGGGVVTMRYPSDSDADTGIKPPPTEVTLAYPSDSDRDIGIGPNPPIDRVTMAYPSDSDKDTGIDWRPPVEVTLAYPSDSDRDCGCREV